jgi:putative oxidoreductase
MKSKILFGVSLLFGLMMINSGLNKLFQYMPMPKDMPLEMIEVFAAFMRITWLMPFIAVVEIIGGILFITNKYRALGAIMLFPIVIGITLFHIVTIPSGIILAIILLAINIWVIIENREKYMPMIK